MVRLLSLFVAIVLSTTACAKTESNAIEASASATELSPVEITQKLKLVRADLNLSDVQDSEIQGFYRAKIVNGPDVYVTKDGKYLIAGDVYEIGERALIDLADKRLSSVRTEALSNIESLQPITFAATTDETKAVIYVFTDVDCGYCQKLHAEMAAYNAAGIEVRYLAYPRAGIGSDAYKKIASAWCAADQNAALTSLKQRKPIPENVCDGNPVADHYALGGKLGVRGTPAILLENGRMLPGYRNAKALAAELGI